METDIILEPHRTAHCTWV